MVLRSVAGGRCAGTGAPKSLCNLIRVANRLAHVTAYCVNGLIPNIHFDANICNDDNVCNIYYKNIVECDFVKIKYVLFSFCYTLMLIDKFYCVHRGDIFFLKKNKNS